jgi:hypothetical protein
LTVPVLTVPLLTVGHGADDRHRLGDRLTAAGVEELVDVRRFGPGERIVPQPYTREMFERTQGWMREWDLLDAIDPAGRRYEEIVLG